MNPARNGCECRCHKEPGIMHMDDCCPANPVVEVTNEWWTEHGIANTPPPFGMSDEALLDAYYAPGDDIDDVTAKALWDEIEARGIN